MRKAAMVAVPGLTLGLLMTAAPASATETSAGSPAPAPTAPALSGPHAQAAGSVVVERRWTLSGLGSDTARFDCPVGYDTGSSGSPTMSSSSSWVSITANPAWDHSTSGSGSVTNWATVQKSTTLSMVCYSS